MASTPVPPLEVSAPEPRGLRYGLLTAASGPLDLPQRALSGGLMYRPVSCGKARLYPLQCPPADTPTQKVFDPATGYVTASTFIAYASEQCGAAGTTSATVQAEVRRRLANGEQNVAEQGMAAALAAAATPVVAADRSDIRAVFGVLEQWLYGSSYAGYGNVGYLHLPARYAAYAGSYGVLFKDGLLWRTHLGTVVSFGGGYPDDGSIYVSGHTTVWRAAEISLPDPGQTFDRAQNQWMVLAEREYAVAFDCVAAVAQFIPTGES